MPQSTPPEHLVSRKPIAFLGNWSLVVCRTCHRMTKISYKQTSRNQSSGMWWPRKELLEWMSREPQPAPTKLTLLVGNFLNWMHEIMVTNFLWVHQKFILKSAKPAQMSRPMKRTFLQTFLDIEQFALWQQMVELLSSCLCQRRLLHRTSNQIYWRCLAGYLCKIKIKIIWLMTLL